MDEVLIVEDDALLREALVEIVSQAGYNYLSTSNTKQALAILEQHSPVIVLAGICKANKDSLRLVPEIKKRVPGLPIIIMFTQEDIDEMVQAIRQGAVDYLLKPLNQPVLVEKIRRYIKPPLLAIPDKPICNDEKSQALFAMAQRIAPADISVMISGESGTGKEVLARFLHHHSSRHNQPFVAINCAAIPEQMLEATLFGYEKGAFTGAYKACAGKFEQAQGGTLLLDEVSEMSLALQAKFLRVLQEKEVERIGSNKIIDLNVRIIATSNRNLLDEVKKGRFREDLYYRLNVFLLNWQPLRERKKDILPLANSLIHRYCYHQQPIVPVLSLDAIKVLHDYSWPGNVRELANVIQRALVLQTAGIIDPTHLQLPIDSIDNNPLILLTQSEEKNLQNYEYQLIEETLKAKLGNRQKVAAVLGISERTLRYKLAKMREEGYCV